ncbi:MAG: hypothetical protein J6Y00_00705 [Paludibacteraceae bacterium]|nr:hypothetical protein [Bacteroidales bacterium]MBP5476196.1 hypothetical protein [Paludibacteraceae bacterium]
MNNYSSYSLLYNPEKGMYYISGLLEDNETKALSHTKGGFKSQTFEIPDGNFVVKINTNFVWDNSKYMSALIKYNNEDLLKI